MTITWGDQVCYEEEAADEMFVSMSSEAFEIEKQVAKRDRRFGSWDAWLVWARRIEVKRKIVRTSVRTILTVSPLSQLVAYRADCMRYPSQYCIDQESFDREIRAIEKDIHREAGGAFKLHLIHSAEAVVAGPEIESTIARVKQQVVALHKCKKLIAATRINAFVIAALDREDINRFLQCEDLDGADEMSRVAMSLGYL